MRKNQFCKQSRWLLTLFLLTSYLVPNYISIFFILVIVADYVIWKRKNHMIRGMIRSLSSIEKRKNRFEEGTRSNIWFFLLLFLPLDMQGPITQEDRNRDNRDRQLPVLCYQHKSQFPIAYLFSLLLTCWWFVFSLRFRYYENKWRIKKCCDDNQTSWTF